MENYISKEKYNELLERVKELKTVKTFEVSERLQKAKEHGDLSENFEYIQAKEDKENLEREIYKLEEIVENAQIVIHPRNKNIIAVGHSVKVKKQDGKVIMYTIVGLQDTDVENLKISNISPIGKALLGKKVGDDIVIKMPNGESKLKVIEIT